MKEPGSLGGDIIRGWGLFDVFQRLLEKKENGQGEEKSK